MQIYIYEAEVLDLFSGSGALAIESISRGAKFAVACDYSKKAVQIIKSNVQKTHFEQQIHIINKDYIKTLDEIKDKKFDIIFLDPPYNTEFGLNSIKYIIENHMLKQEGIIIFETDREEAYIKCAEEFANIKDIRKYGRVKLVFLSK